MEGVAAIFSAARCWPRPPFFMSLHLLILHRRELTFSYEICLPASGNDQNRVLMMIPFEESTLVRCLGGCVLKSVVLQSDLKSLWHMELTIRMRRQAAGQDKAKSCRLCKNKLQTAPLEGNTGGVPRHAANSGVRRVARTRFLSHN